MAAVHLFIFIKQICKGRTENTIKKTSSIYLIIKNNTISSAYMAEKVTKHPTVLDKSIILTNTLSIILFPIRVETSICALGQPLYSSWFECH